MSLKTRMCLIVTALLLALAALSALVQHRHARAGLRESLFDQQLTWASRAAGELGHRLRTRRDALERAARHLSASQFADGAATQRWLEDKVVLPGLFEAVLVIGADGVIVADVPAVAGRRGSSLAGRDYFTRTLALGEPHLSRPAVGRWSAEPGVMITAPVKDATGRTVAVIAGAISLVRSQVFLSVDEHVLGRTDRVSIVSEEGVYVMHPDRARVLASIDRLAEDAFVAGKLAEGFVGSAEGEGPDGAAALFSFARVPQTGWTLVVTYPSAEAFAAIDAAGRAVWAGLLWVALLFTPLVWFMMAWLIAPITALRNRIRKVRASPGTPLETHDAAADEIGDLARDFAELIAEREGAESNLRVALAEHRTLLDNAMVGIAFLRGRRIVRCNPGFAAMFGYAPPEMVNLPTRELHVSEQVWEDLGREAYAALAAEGTFCTENRFRRRDGSAFWVAHSITAVDRGDPALGFIWVTQDVTERRAVRDTLVEERERALVTLQSIADAVIRTDVGGNIDFMNRVAESLTARRTAQVQGLPLASAFNLLGESDLVPIPDPVAQVLESGEVVGPAHPAMLARPEGSHRAIEYSAAPVRNNAQEIVGVVIAFRDVSQQRKMAEQMAWNASHDNLTGLVNRREFEQRLERLLAGAGSSGREHTVLFMDLDQFKVVNDTCGHAAGDELLRQLTLAMLPSMRQSDTLARLGGDEFGVLLANCPIDQAHRVAEALRCAVQDFRFTWEERMFRVGVSIGLVSARGGQSSAEVMSSADAACYIAKDTGRNRVHAHTDEDDRLAQRHGEMEWVSRIHKALEENRFRLHFQSIAPVSGEADAGDHYELLVRMVDEQGRMVPPMTFIPAAERYHLMSTIDRWVIRSAFAFFRGHYGPADGPRLHTAAINVSGASVTDPNFLEFVREQFRESGVPPERICFEITETAAISNLTQATHFIARLKETGCRFSLDDFGSGMSSFAYLKNLPVDYLKIDGGFVKDMVTDPIDDAMVHAINSVGHVMGIRTIAEFVENDAILARLREIGVDYAQGYGIARPRPLAELASQAAAERRSALPNAA